MLSEHRIAHRQAVVLAYRMFLGRDPENDLVVDEILGRRLTEAALGQEFMFSDEFIARMKNMVPLNKVDPRKLEPNDIECNIGDEKMTALFAHVEAVWSHLGRTDPHWSVITNPKYQADSISLHQNEFYDSGMYDVQSLLKTCARNGVDLKQAVTCFELGCGVGRITLQLAELFDRVIGVDISQPHLLLARNEARKRSVENVHFQLLTSLIELSEVATFDVFFSLIVLQHNPPPVMTYILKKVLQKLNPGGIGYFQLPVYAVDYSFHVDKYIEGLGNSQDMEMHAVPQQKIFSILKEAGCDLLEVREDDRVGSDHWISNIFLVRRM